MKITDRVSGPEHTDAILRDFDTADEGVNQVWSDAFHEEQKASNKDRNGDI